MSAQGSFRGCPPPAVLAAFVEGTLDAETRSAVAAHVADCSECVLVVGATAQFLAPDQEEESEGDAEPIADSRQWQIAAAAAGAILVAAVAWYGMARRDPLQRLRTLAAASSVRRVEGRLAGFPYRRFAVMRSEPAEINLAYEAEVERLSRRGRNDAAALHALGVAVLLNADARDAVRLLRRATTLDPSDAAAWTDLAAAEIASSSYADALAAARRAASLAPDASGAHFNAALALDALGRRSEAVRAYRAALAVEDDAGWRREIAQRLAEERH